MSILDWIYPKRCVGCRTSGLYICHNCRAQVLVNSQSLAYEGVVRQVIKEIKYRGSYAMASELVELWVDKCSGSTRQLDSDTVVTAVPMWGPKQKKRGFNQAEVVARELARSLRLEYQDLLIRTRSTRPMYGLTRGERFDNVRGAFELKRGVSLPSKVVLVDDVWTSGATMRECELVLKKGGTKLLQKVAIAR